ncbi:biotin transporter BioY [Guptibacillus hwajinpoensis]|uniref:biotin transporter BioY n=1 Tax=Guptibacillus hwajinpoensis TaxID=208199 RepID=UPI00273AB89A|nr:biotin transporter BioY [Alkalihalobacillus macyae]MDP4549914.1 biotin transporter BioY [Alkalihalobacillus macyae]
MGKMKTIDLVYAGMFAALMAVGANIAQFLVVGGVPITLQTFFAILAGLLLGSRLGATSMIVYTLVGLAGAPVFAQFTGGPGVIFKPTFGFILSYILVAYVAGKIVESKLKPTITTFMIASFTGFILNYVLGTNYMYYAYKLWAAAPEGFTYSMAWIWMLAPLPKDIILSAVAALISPRIFTAVSKTSRRQQGKVA